MTPEESLRKIVSDARPVHAEAVMSRIGVGFSHGYGTEADEREFLECQETLSEWKAASDLLDGLLLKPPGFCHPDIASIIMSQRPLAETYGTEAS